ncbi:MAG: hypothetical protein U0872_04300 [Planctomycetaceae bacterium]
MFSGRSDCMVTFLRDETIAPEPYKRNSTSWGITLHTELYHPHEEMLSFVNTAASFRRVGGRL